MNPLRSGTWEPAKQAVHSVGLVFAAVCFTYNAAAWLLRREKHLAVNAAIYGGLTALEVAHVKHHREKS